MATFKTIVRYKRADGFYQVYIQYFIVQNQGILRLINSLLTNSYPNLERLRMLS